MSMGRLPWLAWAQCAQVRDSACCITGRSSKSSDTSLSNRCTRRGAIRAARSATGLVMASLRCSRDRRGTRYWPRLTASGRLANSAQEPSASVRNVSTVRRGKSGSAAACNSSLTKARASSVSVAPPETWVKRNSSSNWSTTSSSCRSCPRRARRSTSTKPLLPRLSWPNSVSARRACSAASASAGPSALDSASASWPSGAPPGRITTACQSVSSSPWACRCAKLLINPASTSDDLPLPEAPATAIRRRVASRFNNSSICCRRPKKRSASVGLNARRPGNGLASSSA